MALQGHSHHFVAGNGERKERVIYSLREGADW